MSLFLTQSVPFSTFPFSPFSAHCLSALPLSVFFLLFLSLFSAPSSQELELSLIRAAESADEGEEAAAQLRTRMADMEADAAVERFQHLEQVSV